METEEIKKCMETCILRLKELGCKAAIISSVIADAEGKNTVPALSFLSMEGPAEERTILAEAISASEVAFDEKVKLTIHG